MKNMRVRTFILAASAVVAAAFLGAGYLATSGILDHAVRENARATAQAMARSTFNSMYQLMSTGWTRAQAEAYIAALHDATAETGISLFIWRGPAAEADFGAIRQPDPDGSLRDVLASGRGLTETPPAACATSCPWWRRKTA